MKKLLMWCLVVFCSCGYTQLHDPLRIPKPEPVKIVPIMDYHDENPPQVRRDYYARFSHPNYYNNHSPYIYSGYYQPSPRVVYVEAKPVTQPVAKVMKPPAQKDVAKASQVWQKRVAPQVRQSPTPTPR